MPIDEGVWRNGERTQPLQDKICEFLKENGEKAFKPAEIANHFYGLGWTENGVTKAPSGAPSIVLVECLLDQLVLQDMVECRKVYVDNLEIDTSRKWLPYYKFKGY